MTTFLVAMAVVTYVGFIVAAWTLTRAAGQERTRSMTDGELYAMKYRKKPLVIEAMQYIGGDVNALELTAFTRAWEYEGEPCAFGPVVGVIPTMEGVMMVSPGDWVIRGVKGEFYPCKLDIFEKTYTAL